MYTAIRSGEGDREKVYEILGNVLTKEELCRRENDLKITKKLHLLGNPILVKLFYADQATQAVMCRPFE